MPEFTPSQSSIIFNLLIQQINFTQVVSKDIEICTQQRFSLPRLTSCNIFEIPKRDYTHKNDFFSNQYPPAIVNPRQHERNNQDRIPNLAKQSLLFWFMAKVFVASPLLFILILILNRGYRSKIKTFSIVQKCCSLSQPHSSRKHVE